MRSLFLGFAGLVLAAGAVNAADFSGMSRQQTKITCVAYMAIDITSRHDAGLMSDAEYNSMRMRLGHRIQDRGDNYNYAGDYRRMDTAIKQIIDGDPTVQDIATAVQQCQPILRF